MDDPAVSPKRWCDCADAPRFAHGPATLLNHPGDCGFPDEVCAVREHRVTVHSACGLELLMLFCGCGATAFTLDPERGWWVHYVCGWPTQAWYDAAGRPAPEPLAGLRPVTWHEFPVIPQTPKAVYRRLDERQRAVNQARAGTSVRD